MSLFKLLWDIDEAIDDWSESDDVDDGDEELDDSDVVDELIDEAKGEDTRLDCVVVIDFFPGGGVSEKGGIVVRW